MASLRKQLSLAYRKLSSPFRAMPDFIILGTQKGGTRTLYHYLDHHPQILMSKKSEVHFFDLNIEKGDQWYKAQFPIYKKKHMFGECSPYYLYHPLVPVRIERFNPKMKFIVLLRDPVERAFSHYRMEIHRGKETFPFSKAILVRKEEVANNENRLKQKIIKSSKIHQRYSYLERGIYHTQLERWFSNFDKRQFLIIQSEAFFLKTQETLNKVFNFLNVGPQIVNDTKKYNEGTNTITLTEEERIFLKQYYKKHNEALFSLLGTRYNWQ